MKFRLIIPILAMFVLTFSVFAQNFDANPDSKEKVFDERIDLQEERFDKKFEMPGLSSDKEQKFKAFEKALKKQGVDTSGLRNLIDSGELSKQELYERFGKNEIQKAIDVAGVQKEFGQAPDFRESGDKFNYDRNDKYGPPRGEMMYGLLFQHLDAAIDPRELADQCSDPNAIVDQFMTVLRQEVGDFGIVCDEMDHGINDCEARVKQDCSRIGQHQLDTLDDPDDIQRLEMQAWSCPPDTDAMLEACVLRSIEYSSARLEYVDEICAERWEYEQERVFDECSRMDRGRECDKDAFIKDCLGGQTREDYNKQIENDKLERERRFQEERDRMEKDLQSERDRFERQKAKDLEEWERKESERKEQQEKENDINNPPSENVISQPSPDESSGDNEQVDDGTPEEDIPQEEAINEPEQESQADDSSGDGSVITGEAVREHFDEGSGSDRESFDDMYDRCERNFEEFKRPDCERQDDYCTEEGYVSQCIRNEKEWAGKAGGSETKLNCRIDQKRQLQEAQRNCQRMEKDKERCFEEASKRCEGIGDVAAQCRENLRESNVRAFLLVEVEKRCAFASEIEVGRRDADTYEVVLAVSKSASEADLDEIAKLLHSSEKLLTLDNNVVIKGTISKDDVDLLKTLRGVQRYKLDNLPEASGSASVVSKRVANKLANLREENDIPNDIVYVVESEAADIADVSRNFASLEEVEDAKGFVYKFQRFFGLMKEAEENEIRLLGENRERLAQSIESLNAAAAQIDEPVTKAIVLEQVDNLTGQQASIDRLIEDKRDKAKGFIAIFS